jgi:hypothetical protein
MDGGSREVRVCFFERRASGKENECPYGIAACGPLFLQSSTPCYARARPTVHTHPPTLKSSALKADDGVAHSAKRAKSATIDIGIRTLPRRNVRCGSMSRPPGGGGEGQAVPRWADAGSVMKCCARFLQRARPSSCFSFQRATENTSAPPPLLSHTPASGARSPSRVLFSFFSSGLGRQTKSPTHPTQNHGRHHHPPHRAGLPGKAAQPGQGLFFWG